MKIPVQPKKGRTVIKISNSFPHHNMLQSSAASTDVPNTQFHRFCPRHHNCFHILSNDCFIRSAHLFLHTVQGAGCPAQAPETLCWNYIRKHCCCCATRCKALHFLLGASTWHLCASSSYL